MKNWYSIMVKRQSGESGNPRFESLLWETFMDLGGGGSQTYPAGLLQRRQ